jgi:hypothetical protein
MDTPPHSRGTMCPRFSLNSSSPQKQRAQETPDARCTRSLACDVSEAHEHGHHRFTGTTRRFLHNGFNGFLRALPGVPGLLATVVGRSLCRSDTSVGVSGPHDFAVRFTCSSSAARSASTAFRPTFVTIARAPLLSGRNGRRYRPSRDFGKSEYFCETDLTGFLQKLPDGQISRGFFHLSPQAGRERRATPPPRRSPAAPSPPAPSRQASALLSPHSSPA